MISRLNAALRVVLGVFVVSLAGAAPLLAQGGAAAPLGSQTLNPYHFLFIAYALAWILVLGWVVSIGRRISRLAERLEK